MKRTTSLILVLLFSALMLTGEAINTSAKAWCCFDLGGCCEYEICCVGIANGCDITCFGGASISCGTKTKSSCK